MKKNKYFLYSGLLLALSFPPFPVFFASYFAFVFLLLGLEQVKNGEIKNLFPRLYLTFFLYHLLSNWWISSFQEQTDPFLMASGFALDIFHPLFFMIPVYIYLKIRDNFSLRISILLFPVIWTAWEYFHSLGEFSYPWLAVGNSQIYNFYFVQVADIFGVWGVTFLVLLINSILLLGYLEYKDSKKINKNLLISLIIILILPNIYGFIRVNQFEHSKLLKSNESLKIAVIQPNINPWEKWSSGPIAQIRYCFELQDSLYSIEKFDLSVLPETTILRISDEFNKDLKLSFLQNWIDERGVSLLSGFIHTEIYPEGAKRQLSARYDRYNDLWEESYNAAIMINPDDSTYKVYHKGKLTPFAERIPNLEYFSFLSNFIQWGVGISSWGLGQDKFNLRFSNNDKKAEIGSIICIESIYPHFCSEFTKLGAEILTIITNDAWYDATPGPRQHYLIAQMRAIENRRYIARSANSGVSGFISASGKSLKETKVMEREAIAMDVPKLKNLSIYVQIGDIFANLLMYLTLGLLFYVLIIKRFKK
jgi:apolipoprotein N-acyltransferase